MTSLKSQTGDLPHDRDISCSICIPTCFDNIHICLLLFIGFLSGASCPRLPALPDGILAQLETAVLQRALLQRDLLSEDLLLRKDPLCEDLLLRKDPLCEDLLRRNPLSEDLLRRDPLSEDLLSGDLLLGRDESHHHLTERMWNCTMGTTQGLTTGGVDRSPPDRQHENTPPCSLEWMTHLRANLQGPPGHQHLLPSTSMQPRCPSSPSSCTAIDHGHHLRTSSSLVYSINTTDAAHVQVPSHQLSWMRALRWMIPPGIPITVMQKLIQRQHQVYVRHWRSWRVNLLPEDHHHAKVLPR